VRKVVFSVFDYWLMFSGIMVLFFLGRGSYDNGGKGLRLLGSHIPTMYTLFQTFICLRRCTDSRGHCLFWIWRVGIHTIGEK